jgi:hypothetical protein
MLLLGRIAAERSIYPRVAAAIRNGHQRTLELFVDRNQQTLRAVVDVQEDCLV